MLRSYLFEFALILPDPSIPSSPLPPTATHMVERGNYEAIYGNMPVFGLPKATEHVRAVGGRETARRRLMRGENEPAIPSPE